MLVDYSLAQFHQGNENNTQLSMLGSISDVSFATSHATVVKQQVPSIEIEMFRWRHVSKSSSNTMATQVVISASQRVPDTSSSDILGFLFLTLCIT